MKRLIFIGLGLAAVAPAARAAEESFSKAVRVEDFSAAGLAKLSPEELARLDALVRDYKSGALLAAKREAAAAEAARAAAEAKATRAEVARNEAEAKSRVAASTAQAEAGPSALRSDAASAKKSEGGLLAKAKVLLTPGTEVEYAAIESRIAGDFTGWEGRTIFTLENGQRWQVLNGSEYYTPPVPSPRVKIAPASFGGFWLTVEGVNARVRVVQVGGGK